MIRFWTILRVEIFKIRKSKVFWITLAAFMLVPFIAGLFTAVLKYPEFAENAGLLIAQAQSIGEASWPAYLNILAQMVSVGGILIFGFIVSWVFGREFTDRTVKDLLSLPYSRTLTVLAKFVASGLACLLLAFLAVSVSLLIGWWMGLPGGSFQLFADGLFVLFIVTVFTISLSTPVAFVASYGQGYLAPLGFVVLLVVASQLVAATGLGEYFPWSIPAIYSGVAETEMSLGGLPIVLIIATSLAGLLATLLWWVKADHY